MNLESEVRDLVARRDIYEAVCNYIRGQDRLMPALQRSAFHDDAYVDCGLFAGDAGAFVDFAQEFLAKTKQSQHLIGQVQIKLEGDVAHGEVYFLAQHRIVEDDVEKDLFVAGRYIDRYENRGGSWKIAKRLELVDWVRSDKASDSYLVQNTNVLLGARGDADFSNVRKWP